MLERERKWRDIKATICYGQTRPWSKSLVQRLEDAVVSASLPHDEWAAFLRLKLTQLSRRHKFGVAQEGDILIVSSMQGNHKYIQINFNLASLKCHVIFCGEEISECFHITQLMTQQLWIQIRRKMMLIFSLFMPTQTVQQLQNKYTKLKESEQRCNILCVNVTKRNGLSFMEVPIYKSLNTTITMTPAHCHSNSLMLRLSESIYINQLSLDLVGCSLVDDETTQTQPDEIELKKLQVLTKQKKNIKLASAIQFDQPQNIGQIIEVLWVWKRISLLVKTWKMNNRTFIFINKHGIIQSSSNGCSIEVSLCKNGSAKTYPPKVLSSLSYEDIHNCINKENLNSFEMVFAVATTEYSKKRSKSGEFRKLTNTELNKSIIERNDDNPLKHPHLMDILKKY